MKKSLLFLLLALTTFCAGSCIYDFNPDLKGQAGYLVIEGDILVGDYTNVSVRMSEPLKRDGESTGSTVTVRRAYVEGSDGKTYGNGGPWGIDTRSADPKQNYRLVIEIEGRGTYTSEWAPVVQTAQIDSVAWTISDDSETMTVDVSASGEGSRYYRWLAQQTWEYHAAYQASHFYVPSGSILKGQPVDRDTVAMYENGENIYWCWNSSSIPDLMMATTIEYSENRIIRKPLYDMDRYDQRCMYLYSLYLIQEGISEEAWRYYEAMRNNSTDVGGLFSPEPSEMRGNIYNTNDPSELVLGYVCVSAPQTRRVFIDMTNFGRMPRDAFDIEPVYVNKSDWRRRYRDGWLVYALHTDEGAGTGRETEADYEFDWLPKRCVDCRMQNGTKTKPDYWPNDHH